jgi:hypothetical protein
LFERAAARFAEKGRKLRMDQVEVGDYGHRIGIALPNRMACRYECELWHPDGTFEKNPNSIEDLVDLLVEQYPEGFAP